MSISSMVKQEREKLDADWHAKYPNGLCQLKVLQRQYRTEDYKGYRVVAEVLTMRPTSHGRASHGLILGKPGLQHCPWVTGRRYNKVTYTSFAELKTALTEIVFPVEDIKALEEWYKQRYPNARY